MFKTCSKCGETLPLERFRVEVRPDGRTFTRGACRHCREVVGKMARRRPPPPDETAPEPVPAGSAPPPPPIEFVPKVSPVAIGGELESILIIPDTHVPYHDERAWQVMLAVAKSIEPDRIIILGDFVDFYAVSFHAKALDRSRNLKWEIEQAKLKREDLDGLGATNKVYIKGNHEDRLDRFLSTYAGPINELVDFDREMGLTANGWAVVPYKQGYDLGHVSFTHDTGSAGINAHRQSMNVYHGSVVIGHTHRMAYDVVGSTKGKRILAAMLGWLGDFDRIDYVHKQKALRDWVHGFGIGHHEPETGLVYVQPVPIVNYTCAVHGVKYAANW